MFDPSKFWSIFCGYKENFISPVLFLLRTKKFFSTIPQKVAKAVMFTPPIASEYLKMSYCDKNSGRTLIKIRNNWGPIMNACDIV